MKIISIKKEIKFSVVIPLYNKETHIIRAIESVINQTYSRFELIIVNDGSTDDGLQEAKKIFDPRIRIINQENRGVSNARNKGIEEAQFDFIAFLDADDEWKPDFLNSIRSLIECYPDAGAYGTAYEIAMSNSIIKPVVHYKIFRTDWTGTVDDFFKYALMYPLISSSSVTIPKSIFKDIGYFSSGISHGEDRDMWARIALKYDIAYVNVILATYFWNAENRASNQQFSLESSILSYAKARLDMYQDIDKKSKYYKEYLIKDNILLAEFYILNGQTKKAMNILWKLKGTRLNRKLWLKTLIKGTPIYTVASKLENAIRFTIHRNK